MKNKDRIKKDVNKQNEPGKNAVTQSEKNNEKKGYNEKNPSESEGAFTPDSKSK